MHMPGHLELRTESSGPRHYLSGKPVHAGEGLLNNVTAEMERHADGAERDMARVRRALHRVATATGGYGTGLALARKAALAAAAADSALDRLGDAARGSFDSEDVVDLLLAARSTTDALRASADLVEMAASLVALPASGPEG
jgi:hypothetical protein